MINPGAAPIPDADPELAAANMAVFRDAVAERVTADDLTVEEPVRDTSADTDGRYGWVLSTADGSEVRVSMPGVPFERVRDMSTSAPCLRVGADWWWWPSAVTVAAALMR